MAGKGKGEEVYVASIDQGTTSTRFIIYDRHASPVASHQLEFKQHYPEAGWVEHDPMEIMESVKVCMEKTLEKAAANGLNVDAGLKAIGITNQRETTVVWSKSTGLPLYNAIVWMDVRTSSICRRLESELSGGRTHFVETCGLPISTYFSALKLLWLMENVDAIKDAVKAGDALFGTIDTWLIWNLTGGIGGKDCDGKELVGQHVTDCSNASRTMLMNLKALDWDKPTLEALGIPASILPKIISNSEKIGVVASGFPLAGVSISGCLGDQHAAMLGQLCQKGEAKSTYGTGAFILLNTGEEVTQSTHGLLSTIAYKLGPDVPTNYALEGSIAIAGAAVQWLRDSLGIISSAAEIEGLAESVQDSPPSRLLSKHRPRRRAAPPRPTLPPPAPTRGPPDLNRCHCCVARFQPPAPGAKRRPLRPLRSLWRVLLLCSECISLLRSGAVCSYCLSLDNLPHEDSVTCRSCNLCVHHYCIPAEHRTAMIQPVDLENFVCVDCCPTVKVGSKKSVPNLELVIREPSSAVQRKGEPVAAAKLNSPRKVVEEVRPAWKDAMALVPVGEGSDSKGPSDPDLPDEALALQLHLAINGSPRISRSGSASLVVSSGQGKRQGKRQNGLVYGRKVVKEDLGLCVTNMMDHLDYLETGEEMGSNWNASQALGSDPTVPVVLALECKGKPPQESTRGKRKGPPETTQHNSLVEYKVDRYEKKYSKRKSSKQTHVESNGNKTLPNGKDMDVGEGGEGISPMT